MKIGTIGTSDITRKFIEASLYVDQATVTSVFSRDEERGRAFAEQHGVSQVFSDLDEMLLTSLDVVYIASPNVLHFDHIMKALDYGVHVICEKPLLTSVEQFEAAYAKADEKGLFLFEAMRNLHTPNFERLVTSLERVDYIQSAYFHRMRYSSKYEDYLQGYVHNVFKKEMAGGALLDLGVYPLSLAIALFGEPITSRYEPNQLETGVDATGILTLQYDKFNCVIMCSKVATSYNASEIHGENGTIRIDNVAPISDIEWLPHKGQDRLQLAEEEKRPNMSYELEQFIGMIENNDHELYHKYRRISRDVVSVVEKSLS
ncbi:Gfo/Idh/MocA family protein [Alkalibacillus salilacus]|uniref:Dehydrogenase n=1 Tax=Alkalibacillus salilacus TaxID=284582 RepID=A0ABT9VHM3_9BACI|nr:Gfo/Idh/MocA family oxidoreductase [Alkalibacillus salilacus]MDQ0160467.1 putative dehydrogenase [Alkalibacillus salilacus]